MAHVTVTPPVGIDYKSMDDARKAFTSGQRFVDQGSNANVYITDFNPGDSICIRYGKRRKFVMYIIPQVKESF